MTDDKLTAYAERRENLESQKQAVAEDIKQLNLEIKGDGYDMPAFNAVMARRKKNRDDVDNLDAMVELYEDALGAG